jgi:hypothetical protein
MIFTYKYSTDQLLHIHYCPEENGEFKASLNMSFVDFNILKTDVYRVTSVDIYVD